MIFQRASDEELKDAGFDPSWISLLNDLEVPYAAYHFFNGVCPHCGSQESGWGVVNIQTATGHSQEWYGDNAECDAEETAAMLNGAWKEGRDNVFG